MNRDEREKFWSELRAKNGQLTTAEDLAALAQLRAESANDSFNNRFPNWTHCETAVFRPETQEIYVVHNSRSDAEDTSARSHGERAYQPNDAFYQEVFLKHKFDVRKDQPHWIVSSAGRELGNGWD